MKYLIAFILLTNLSYAATCDTDTIANIEKCNVDDKIQMFVNYEQCHFKKESGIVVAYSYANLICDPTVSLSFFEAKLQEWKAERIAFINEQNRLENVKIRLGALGIVAGRHGSISGLREYMKECGYTHPNPAIWVKDVYKVGNLILLECLESKKIKVAKDKKDAKDKENLIKLKKDLMKNYDCNLETGYVKLLCESRK